MMEIFHRTSIRKYLNKPVEEEKLMLILKAAMQAPSAGNQQPWEFYVTDKKDIIAALSETSPYAGCLKGAPLAVVTAYREDVRHPAYAQIDLSIAMENMWLETDSLGLGGVWLGIAPLEDRMKKVEEIAGIPSGIRAFGIFALGYPAEEKEQQDRYKPERVHRI